jgi:hypothetical protein
LIVETEESSAARSSGLATLSVASSVVTLLAALALRENGWNGWAIVAIAAVIVGLITGGIGSSRPGGTLAVAGLALNVLLGAGLLIWFARILEGLE